MASLPPGISFIVRRLHHILLPPAVVQIGIKLLEATGVTVPTWASVVASVFSIPAAFTISILWTLRRNERKAASLGAVMTPKVFTKTIGGYDLIKAYSADSDSRFPGYRIFQWFEEYGPVCNFRIFFEDRIITSEPEYIKIVLSTGFPNYAKGPELQYQLSTLLGTGVFNSDGEMWKFHRAMTRPFFSRDRISHFDIFDRHATKALNLMKSRLREGHPVDWQDVVSRFTLDSATLFLFGADVASLEAGLAYPPSSGIASHTSSVHHAEAFAQAFLAAQTQSAKRGRFGQAWPLYEFWSDKVAEQMKVIDAFVEPFVKDALQKKAAKGKADATEEGARAEDDETLLSHLVNFTDDARILKDETLNILLAGRDTTAATLTAAIYMLCEHPDIASRLRREIIESLGSRRPSYDDIRDLKYLRAFINEVLRLYPPVPFNIRYTTGDAVWPPTTPGQKPLYIPAHTRVMYSVFVMHRRKDLWGPDAAEFDPDRFIDERLHKYITPNPFIFLPFNAGPRICLGQQFAYNETSFMLIRLLQQFSSFELAQQEANPSKVPPPTWAQSAGSNGKDRVRVKAHFTMFVDGGLWVKMGEAKDVDSI